MASADDLKVGQITPFLLEKKIHDATIRGTKALSRFYGPIMSQRYASGTGSPMMILQFLDGIGITASGSSCDTARDAR
jgi:hypothetical protein